MTTKTVEERIQKKFNPNEAIDPSFLRLAIKTSSKISISSASMADKKSRKIKTIRYCNNISDRGTDVKQSCSFDTLIETPVITVAKNKPWYLRSLEDIKAIETEDYCTSQLKLEYSNARKSISKQKSIVSSGLKGKKNNTRTTTNCLVVVKKSCLEPKVNIKYLDHMNNETETLTELEIFNSGELEPVIKNEYIDSIDKQIRLLQIAAIRYCRSARKVLQRHNKSYQQSHPRDDDIDDDVDLIQAKVNQLLQATHIAVDTLTKQKMDVLESEEEKRHRKMQATAEEINAWKMIQQPLSCRHVEEADRINTLIAEEYRRSEVRDLVRRGLCRFARMVLTKRAKEELSTI